MKTEITRSINTTANNIISQVTVDKISEVYSPSDRICKICDKSIRRVGTGYLPSLKEVYNRKFCSRECRMKYNLSLRAIQLVNIMFETELKKNKLGEIRSIIRIPKYVINRKYKRLTLKQKLRQKKLNQPSQHHISTQFRRFWVTEEKTIKKKLKLSIKNDVLSKKEEWEKITAGWEDEIRSIGNRHPYYCDIKIGV